MVLTTSLLYSGKLSMPLLGYCALYLVASALTAFLKRRFQHPWLQAVPIIVDTFFILRIFTLIGPLESYLLYAYIFLIAVTAFSSGLKGSLAIITIITVFDYFYIRFSGETFSFSYSPAMLRLGLSWIAALAFGSASRNIAEAQESIAKTHEEIQKLNDDLDSKMTVLISAGRALGSINDLDKLVLYFTETIGKIFSLTEYVLVVKSEQSSHLSILSSSRQQDYLITDDLFDIKDDMLITNIGFNDLNLSLGATHKGTQGFYLLFVGGDGLQAILNDKDIFQTVFSQFILAIDNALLVQKAQEASLTDHLTKLYNQRYFYERVNEELNRAKRTTSSLALLMIDIDNFKKHNDAYGHLNGDKALYIVASVISSCCRESDVAARYGGEEFIVILPDTTSKDAANVADRIIKGVRESAFPGCPGQAEVHLTVSIGIADYPEYGDKVLEIIQRADEALYKAKETGKDKFVVAKKKRATTRQQSGEGLIGA